MTHFSAAQRRKDVDEMAARSVMGTRGLVTERFSLGSSRRFTLQGFTRGSAIRILGGFIVLA